MIKLIVFDVDGTLVDTDEVILATWKELIRLYKPSDYFLDDSIIRTFSGPPLKDSLKRVFPELDQGFIFKEYNRITPSCYKANIRTFSNASEVLNKLKKEGYQLAIFTNKDSKMTRYTLELARIDIKLFSIVVTSDDVENLKPNPEGLLKILNYTNIKAENAINVGDTEFDYYCGKNAGIKTIMMTMKHRNYESKIFPLSFCSNYNDLYKEIKKYDN
jgi:pyrophosphatase PpaX